MTDETVPMVKLTVRVPKALETRIWWLGHVEERIQSDVLREALEIGVKKMSMKRRRGGKK